MFYSLYSFSHFYILSYYIILISAFLSAIYLYVPSPACGKENGIVGALCKPPDLSIMCLVSFVYGCLASYRKRWLDIVFVLLCIEIDISCTSDVTDSKTSLCFSDYPARALRQMITDMIANSCKLVYYCLELIVFSEVSANYPRSEQKQLAVALFRATGSVSY